MEITVVEILKEIAKTVGSVVLKQLGTSPIERDMNTLYRNVKSYHSRTRELLKHRGEKLKRRATKLADDIEKDTIFFVYVTTEKAEKIVYSLRHLHKLSWVPITSSGKILRRKRPEQTQIIRYLLKIFEEIFGSIQSKQIEKDQV